MAPIPPSARGAPAKPWRPSIFLQTSRLGAVEGSAQFGGDLLGRGFVDEDAADGVGALRVDDDLDVPVVVVADRRPVPLEDARAEIRRRVQDQLVAGIAEGARKGPEVAREQPREVA